MEGHRHCADQEQGRKEVSLIVTMAHLRSIPGFSKTPGFCIPGARRFFAAHGLDFRAFAREGIPASQLEATGDGLALALVAWAKESEAGNGR